MLINRVIINSSPLIVLFKSQQANLLPQLFTEIFIPQAVWDEITEADQNDAASQQLPSLAWARRVEVSAVAHEVAAWNLGNGESEVLSLALQTSNCAVIIDDRAARRCAKSLGLVTIGTGRVLLLAKQRGLIPTVSERIQALRDAGLWLSDSVFNILKKEAGE